MSIERPDSDTMLSAPSTSAAKASPTPANGLASQISLTGQSSGLDPMRGKFISEEDPRAKAILAKRAELIREARSGKKSTKLLQVGNSVYHKKQKEYAMVASEAQGNRIEVMFSSGKRKLVQIVNLEKV